MTPTFPRGSEWRKWDFHFHTPSSFDYKNSSLSAKAIVGSLVNANIAAVVVTDHHRIDVQRIQELRQEAGSEITFFPGIELRTELGGSESIHIIGLFSEDAELEHLWTKLQALLAITPKEVQEKGDDRVYVAFERAAGVIRELGGLVSVHAGKKSNSIERIANAAAFKQAVKEDLAKKCVDFLEINRVEDAHEYEQIVFPAIRRVFPLISGSDNHNADEYKTRLQTWIKGDTTFQGLRQILHEPVGRVFHGDRPPIIQQVAENATRYIRNVEIKKIAHSTLGEGWFDCSVPLNPGLVAIIGNKGSGKSAFADIVGLIGNSRNEDAFSFLSADKFRQPKHNKASHFIGRIEWYDGSRVERPLSQKRDPTLPESVRYLPQSFLESVCNELKSPQAGAFDRELKEVVFSHVAEPQRLLVSIEECKFAVVSSGRV